MNKEIKKYIKYVKKIIPFYSKDKKEFLKLLTQKIIEFSNTHPNFTYQNIIDEFGSPNEVAGSYIETLNSDEIIKKLNKKKIINIFCVNNCINSFLSFEWIEIIFLTYFIYFFISLLIFFAFTKCNDFKYTLHILSKFNNCLF